MVNVLKEMNKLDSFTKENGINKEWIRILETDIVVYKLLGGINHKSQ